jgi:hypothetical protein
MPCTLRPCRSCVRRPVRQGPARNPCIGFRQRNERCRRNTRGVIGRGPPYSRSSYGSLETSSVVWGAAGSSAARHVPRLAWIEQLARDTIRRAARDYARPAMSEPCAGARQDTSLDSRGSSSSGHHSRSRTRLCTACHERAVRESARRVEWWRRRELNPRPKALPRRTLHAYPLLLSRARRGEAAEQPPGTSL